MLALTFALVAAAGAGADQGYSDARGDAASGTDITDMTVRNTAAGDISIQVGLANPLPGNHIVEVDIDADKNSSTGDDGIDYYMYGGPLFGANFFAWNGSAWVQTFPPGFAIGSVTSNVVDFRMNRTALGGTSGFRFAVFSASVDQGSAGFEFKVWDAAGYYIYDLTSPTQCSNGLDDDGDGKIDTQDPGCSSSADNDETDTTQPPAAQKTVKISKTVRQPSVPYAGEWYSLYLTVQRVGYPGRFNGSVACEARIGGVKTRWLGSVGPGEAECSFLVPPTAVGKTISGRVTVSEGEAIAALPFKATITRQPTSLTAGAGIETAPLTPQAGRQFFYKLPVLITKGIREPRSVAARDGVRVTCRGRLGGAPLPPFETKVLPNTGVRCGWQIPHGTAGLRFSGTITVVAPKTGSSTAATLTHSFVRVVS